MPSANRWFLSLLVPALLSLVGVAWAQPEQYVVIYVEFQPQEANHGKKLVDDLARESLESSGVINFSSLREAGRSSRFTLVERWTSAAAYQAYKASSTWTTFVTSAQPLLAAPLDERPGVLLEPTP
jgi:quinol monooxygenase YgiN